MYVVTPICAAAAAAVVSAVVLRRPTKEYTHPYSMMHRRLPTARIVVAPPYHQLLVNSYLIPGDLRVNHLILDQRATTAAMPCSSVSRG